MNQDEVKFFFECLGEVWRDITAIEFLMRCAIARKDGEIGKFPKPPYTKGKVYKEYPKSFSNPSFGEITKEFNKYFPNISLPQELIQLRHAMAHGVIAEIDKNGVNHLVKFKRNYKKELEVEFSMPLEAQRITQIRQLLKEFRRYIGKEADDNKK
ncbi:hypothetical protein KJ980_05510 [Patescibacteria group bacterium]|nr:hypothetical protein [Patescibacteria group bacterium]MBU4016845.1 hypothetical protein [Patescibacteria group bacterium]MBU4099078.1 hypothetical protein [Patescibacteria group bacterium]